MNVYTYYETIYTLFSELIPNIYQLPLFFNSQAYNNHCNNVGKCTAWHCFLNDTVSTSLLKRVSAWVTWSPADQEHQYTYLWTANHFPRSFHLHYPDITIKFQIHHAVTSFNTRWKLHYFEIVMGNLGELSPEASVAVRYKVTALSPFAQNPNFWLSADWHTGWPAIYLYTESRSDASAQVAYSGGRERASWRTQTTTQTKEMAAWNGDVHYVQYCGKHNPDNNSSIACSFDFTSIWTSV